MSTGSMIETGTTVDTGRATDTRRFVSAGGTGSSDDVMTKDAGSTEGSRSWIESWLREKVPTAA